MKLMKTLSGKLSGRLSGKQITKLTFATTLLSITIFSTSVSSANPSRGDHRQQAGTEYREIRQIQRALRQANNSHRTRSSALDGQEDNSDSEEQNQEAQRTERQTSTRTHRRNEGRSHRNHRNNHNVRHNVRHNSHNISHHSSHRNRNHHAYRDDRRHQPSWFKAGDFRTKKGRTSDRIVNVNDSVIALEIEGRRRITYIDEAYIEFANGKLRRAPELEGYYEPGEIRKKRFRHSRQVRRVHLEVSPEGRRRGYARLNYKKR